jgi:hypothetical protein
MRLLHLYLRSRRVPAALLALVTGTAGLGLLRGAVDEPKVRLSVLVLALAVGVVVATPGLAGDDVALDRTAAIGWPPRRAAHLLVAGVVVGGAVALFHHATGTAPGTAAGIGAGIVVRDAAGLAGLAGLGAAGLGAGRAWLLPLGWAGPVAMLGPTAGTWYREVLTWLAQPAGTTSATVTATVLAVAGAVAYTAVGSRR